MAQIARPPLQSYGAAGQQQPVKASPWRIPDTCRVKEPSEALPSSLQPASLPVMPPELQQGTAAGLSFQAARP